MKSVVVIHTGGLGDLIQACPVLAALGRTWPRATLTLVGHRDRASLARAAGLADEVIEFETCGLHRLFAEDAAPDQVPDAVGRADLVLTFLTRAPFTDNLRRLVSGRIIAVRPFPAEGTCDRPAAQFVYDQVAEALALPPCDAVARLRLPPDTPAIAQVAGRFPHATHAVAIHPGSGSRAKNWPLERFRELASRLAAEGLQAIWILGPAEAERAEFSPVADAAHCLAGAALVDVAALLGIVRCYVGNDSGITHLAAAMGTPTLALFGPTDPQVWAPRGPDVHTLVDPTGTMNAITPARAWRALRPLALCHRDVPADNTPSDIRSADGT